MEKGFIDKVKENATVQIWFEKTQQEKDDSLTEGYMLELWDFSRISVTQTNLQELKEKRVDVFALSIYGLVIFPKALGHIDEAVSDLFDRLEKRVTPVPTSLAETFRSLSGERFNDNVPESSQENTRPIEEHLQVILSELEIIKPDFEKRSSELEKRIEQ
ncbi:hypothetical protein Gogos_021678 [Gossypium gossypioides]|uniref:DUF7745 domain-containing protein n=1 Tax=Gossypium gossypioides TaxID=34282 RepID=A0A7J9D7G4_GOSGO|nr:hypothetical protein [Gossypium gossypioides]